MEVVFSMQETSIAIIIPTYNEAKNLSKILDGMRNLDVDELLFSDGGSSDKTCSLLSHHHTNYVQTALGRALQMNEASKLCKSDIFIFIHADTNLCSSDLLEVKACMLDDDLVGGRFDVRLSGEHWMFRVIEFFINLRSRMTGISTGDQCQFVRRSVFEEMGGFPEQALMEDVEFSKQLKRYGKIACLKNKVVTSSRRWEKYGIIKTVVLMWKLRLLYWLGTPPKTLAEMYRNAR